MVQHSKSVISAVEKSLSWSKLLYRHRTQANSLTRCKNACWWRTLGILTSVDLSILSMTKVNYALLMNIVIEATLQHTWRINMGIAFLNQESNDLLLSQFWQLTICILKILFIGIWSQATFSWRAKITRCSSVILEHHAWIFNVQGLKT